MPTTTVYRTPCPPPAPPAPPSPPPFRWGLFFFDLARVTGAVVFGAALCAASCYSLPASDGCTPGATRCSPAGVPQTCSPGQRWTAAPLALPCAERVTVTGERAGFVCRETRSVYPAPDGGPGRMVWACAPPVADAQDAPDAQDGAL